MGEFQLYIVYVIYIMIVDLVVIFDLPLICCNWCSSIF